LEGKKHNKEEKMKKLLFALLILFVFSISAYAQMGSDMTGRQKCDMQHGTMMGEGQQMPMMDCPKMQQMQGQGMMQGCQQMGQGMMGGMMGMARDRVRPHKPWFRYGVSLVLRNADRLGLSDEQKKQLDDIRIRYSKEIVKQNAELEIAEIDLETLLNKSEFNLSEIKEALKKVESAKMQIKYLRVEAFVEARKILTNEQKGSLKKLMEMRGTPRMRGMMDVPESEGEDKETPEEEVPETDIHGH
jgi:Spy/CpxP family protein refolding chaperone